MEQLKNKYYKFTLEDKQFSLVEQIVFTIFNDVYQRSGMLDGIDEDTQEEILEKWIEKVKIIMIKQPK